MSLEIQDPTQSVAQRMATAELMAKSFGRRGDEADLLCQWRDQPLCCVRAAVLGGKIVGIGVLTVRRAPDLSSYSRAFQVNLQQLFGPGHIAFLNQMVVVSRHRRNGLATAIGAALLDWLERRPVVAVLGVSWEHGGADNSTHLLRAAGFRELGRCRGFYRQFHEQTGQHCTVCAPENCRCTGLLHGAEASQLRSPRASRQLT